MVVLLGGMGLWRRHVSCWADSIRRMRRDQSRVRVCVCLFVCSVLKDLEAIRS